MFVRLSIFRKMLIAPMLALGLFVAYMAYVGIQQQSTQEELQSIQNRHFPVLNTANENIVLLDGVVKSFEDVVGAKEEAWLDKSLILKDSIEKNLNQLKEIADPEHKKILLETEKSFLNYFDYAFELSKLLIKDDKNLERIELLSSSMPTALKQTKELFTSFKNEQHNSFTDTIKNINSELRQMLIFGALLGLFSFVLILSVMMVLSINTRRSVVQLLKVVTDMADGNPDFSKRIKQSSRDEFGMLAEQFNRFTQKLEKDYNELGEAKQNVENANRTKSEFLANISHEIRTPLNAVIGFSELIEKTDTTQEQSAYLRSIKTGSKVLLSLINDILDLSKIEAGKLEIQPELLNLKLLLDEVCQIFEPNIKDKGLALKINVSSSLPDFLLLDETRIRQVFFNLIGNAIKFTEAGQIEVRAYSRRENSTSKIALFMDVEDTGIGIPDDQQQNIFESFRQKEGQSNRKYGGTGLGLAISLKLVQMMGGTLEVKSTVGAGSTFMIHLPEVQIYDTKREPSSYVAKTDTKPEVKLQSKEWESFEITDADMISLWENANKNGMFHDVLLFGEALMKVADQNGLESVKEYAKNLQKSVSSFDVESIEKQLKEFSSKIKM